MNISEENLKKFIETIIELKKDRDIFIEIIWFITDNECGENELEALAEGGFRVLDGIEEVMSYT